VCIADVKVASSVMTNGNQYCQASAKPLAKWMHKAGLLIAVAAMYAPVLISRWQLH